MAQPTRPDKIVENISNTELRNVVKDYHILGQKEKPAKAELPKTLNDLFEASNREYWSDKYIRVGRLLQSELWIRVVNDKI